MRRIESEIEELIHPPERMALLDGLLIGAVVGAALAAAVVITQVVATRRLSRRYLGAGPPPTSSQPGEASPL